MQASPFAARLTKVIKFGGTSVASAENIRKVIAIVADMQQTGCRVVVVSSAMGGVTDVLLATGRAAAARQLGYREQFATLRQRHTEAVRQLLPPARTLTALHEIEKMLREVEDLLTGISLLGQMPPFAQDALLGYGERLSCYLIAEAMREAGLDAVFADASKWVRTDSNFGNAKMDAAITYPALREAFAGDAIPVVTGFIGSNALGQATTLGRGGSDYTAAIIGAALAADEILIYTDVDGMLTADPRRVEQATTIAALSYSEAMELSHFGAKVIYLPTLQPAMAAEIPVWIKNTFNPTHEGTLICKKPTVTEANYIKGISSISDVALVQMEGSGLMQSVGLTAKVFAALAAADIQILFLTEASSQHSLCFAVAPKDVEAMQVALEAALKYEFQSGNIQPLQIETGKSIVAVVGENMKRLSGVSGKLFGTLGRNGISVAAIAQGASELNISVVIDKIHEAKALNALHEVFFAQDQQSINLFVVGYTGLIGSTLLAQIQQQKEILKKEKNIVVNIIGVINSRTMLLNSNGISVAQLAEKVTANSQPANLAAFIGEALRLNFANSALVDCSAGNEIVPYYADLLSASISVLTPNKIANTLPYSQYTALRQAARRSGAQFRYETNVGAGLPVISTLHALLDSGDRVLRIEAVLSGSLSFIFNSFKDAATFTEVVRQARALGYTEPDPRDDLSGLDVARKALILSRECGFPMELADIQVENLVPEECRATPDVEAFLTQLMQHDAAFEHLKQQAAADGGALRYTAVIEEGRVAVKLQIVPPSNPFYGLSGSDNMIAFTTERYKSNPLVVRGPGAGAAVTAAGVFAEIISLAMRR